MDMCLAHSIGILLADSGLLQKAASMETFLETSGERQRYQALFRHF